MIMDFIKNYFEFKKNKTNFRTEILAGLTTFLTMAYIIVVNPAILSSAGMDFGSVFIATVLIAVLSTLFMGLYANWPVALAPGMGLNAFFTYAIVLGMGIPWQTALGIVFLSGILFLIISVTPLRSYLINSIPNNLKIGIAVGVGFFLTLIGLKNAGLIVSNPATIVGLGNIAEVSVILVLAGFALLLFLEARKIPGSIIISVLFITILSFIFLDNKFIGIVGTLPEFTTFLALDIPGALSLGLLSVIFSILFVDFFDTTGTLTGVTESSKNLSLKKSRRPLIVDSLATIVGSLFGTSNTTSYLESVAGIKKGGKTGFVAVIVAGLFLLSLLFYPLINSIPAYATAPALIFVGLLFMKNLVGLKSESVLDMLPVGITVLLIPFTFSITHGILFGFISYLIIELSKGNYKQISLGTYIISILGIIFLIF